MLDSAMRNLHVLLRADSIIAELRVRQALNRSGLGAVALFLLGLAVIMLNAAGFLALERVIDAVWAAVAVSLCDMLLAGVAALVSSSVKPGRELDLAQETQRAALDALQNDARGVQLQLAEMRQEVDKIGRSVLRFANDPLYAALPGLIVPLTGVLLKALKKPSEAPTKDA